MAYIIVVLKVLLGLDGITEYRISKIVEKINSVATDKGLLTSKLFSFQEWQRYIECRKIILVNAHFPTKLKYSPNTHGIDSLYSKFLGFINSKGEREVPEVNNSKHSLPEELITVMKRYVTDINTNDVPDKEIELFAPSLTPLYSYLQQLLNHPFYDLPYVVQTDFFFTKVGYMTKPDCLRELATQCRIELDIVDSNVHFLEKVVPPFEQPRMPSIDELKQRVEVQDDTNAECVQKSENVNDYLHRKMPFKIELNARKRQYYDSINNSVDSTEVYKLGNDFTFNDTLPNGRLAIPPDSDSEDEDNHTKNLSSASIQNASEDSKIFEQYNLCLSDVEKGSMRNAKINRYIEFRKKQKLRFIRNAKGQFLKRDDSSAKIEVEEKANDNTCPKIDDPMLLNTTSTNFMQWVSNELEKLDENFLNGDISEIDFTGFDNMFNFSQISILNEPTLPETTQGTEISGRNHFFRPFKDYWMHHCIFSRVKPKNFQLFEKTLSKSFRWLLNECAHIVEMPMEDLYEEVCLIEAYYTEISKPNISESSSNDNSTEAHLTGQAHLILNKW